MKTTLYKKDVSDVPCTTGASTGVVTLIRFDTYWWLKVNSCDEVEGALIITLDKARELRDALSEAVGVWENAVSHDAKT